MANPNFAPNCLVACWHNLDHQPDPTTEPPDVEDVACQQLKTYVLYNLYNNAVLSDVMLRRFFIDSSSGLKPVQFRGPPVGATDWFQIDYPNGPIFQVLAVDLRYDNFAPTQLFVVACMSPFDF